MLLCCTLGFREAEQCWFFVVFFEGLAKIQVGVLALALHHWAVVRAKVLILQDSNWLCV